MKFSQFEFSCSYPITAEQAWHLANAYWNNEDGRTDGDAGSLCIVRIVLTDTPNSASDYYCVAFQKERYVGGGMEGYECMPPCESWVEDYILVNAFTGEITTPAYEESGKAISLEEAIQIAKKHFEESGEYSIEEKGYRVEQAVDAQAPAHVYVIVIKWFVIDHYSVFSEIWIDKYTGEIILPYYLQGK